jgi:hypothetical protein
VSLQTRRPTGRPSWPIVLLAGREGAGKSWAAASTSASPMIGRTLWVSIGEDDPDEYGIIPGADFEIVEHDGSYRGELQAIRDAVAEPAGELPTLLVIDSMTRLWNQLSDNAQVIANTRRKGRKTASDDYSITPDLWGVAAGQWQDVMDAVRAHRGPVLLTARLDEVMVMENGQPTSQKTWKVQGHKSLSYDVGVVVEMRERGAFLITKARSARMSIEKPLLAPGFTVQTLWNQLGIESGEDTGERSHQAAVTDPDETPAEVAQQESEPTRDWEKEMGTVTDKQALRALFQQVPRRQRTKRLEAMFTEYAQTIPDQPLAVLQASPEPERPWAKESPMYEEAAGEVVPEVPAPDGDQPTTQVPLVDDEPEPEPYGGGDRA